MKIDCPHCGVHGTVDDSLAGRKLRCPKCSKVFLVTDDMVPDVDESNLVHQEILNDSPEAVESTGAAPAAVATAELAVDIADTQESAEDTVAVDEELEISEEDMYEPAPVQPGTEMSTCFSCGQSFAAAFLEEIDNNFYCALCASDDEGEDVEEDLSFESEEQESSVEDDGEDTTPAVIPDNLEGCAGGGESLHPQFLDSYEGKQ
ncbi:MAG: hypothetical protein DSY80_10060, partial [Desulfocapsa sp.]